MNRQWCCGSQTRAPDRASVRRSGSWSQCVSTCLRWRLTLPVPALATSQMSGYVRCVPSDIKSFFAHELEAQFEQWNEPAYRVKQLLEWLYPRRAANWETMSNLPKALRQRLAAEYSFDALTLVTKQG